MEFHEIANCFPLLEGQSFHDLVEDVRTHGLLQAILTFEDRILDGRNRWRACEVAGVVPRLVAYEGTWAEARATVVSLNLQRRNLTESEKAIAGAKLASLKHGGDRSKSPIGDLKSTVGRRAAADLVGVPVRSVDRASVIVDHGVPELVEAVSCESVPMSTGAEIARASREIQPVLMAAGVTAQEARRIAQETPEVQAAIVAAPDPVEAAKAAAGRHENLSGDFEWYTPSEIIEKARSIMGTIDTDPATCEAANANVNAATYYTAETNGLDKPWLGNVWLNPPFSKDLFPLFVDKMLNEINVGNVKQAAVIVNSTTDTRAFQRLACAFSAICFTRGRVRFWSTDKAGLLGPTQGQAVLYYGPNVTDFIEQFRETGLVCRVS